MLIGIGGFVAINVEAIIIITLLEVIRYQKDMPMQKQNVIEKEIKINRTEKCSYH